MSGGEIIDILCCWVVTGDVDCEPLTHGNAVHPRTLN